MEICAVEPVRLCSTSTRYVAADGTAFFQGEAIGRWVTWVSDVSAFDCHPCPEAVIRALVLRYETGFRRYRLVLMGTSPYRNGIKGSRL